ILIEGETNVCALEEESYSLTGLSGKTYSWNVNEGSIIGSATNQSIDVNWTGTLEGTISVVVTSGSGCTALGALAISKSAVPETSEIRTLDNAISGPGYLSEVCPGDTGLFYAVSGSTGSTFIWNVDGGNIKRDYGDSVIIDWELVPGEYEINVQETSQYSCVGTLKSATIKMISSPDVELGNDTSICEGDIFRLTPAGEFQAINWHDGSTSFSYETASEGMISCTVFNDAGCKVSDELYLELIDSPHVDLGQDTSICGYLILDSGGDGIYFNWSTGEVSQQIEISSGRHEITVEVENEFGCFGSDTIIIDDCNLKDYFIDIPNLITPNYDGKNDIWIIDELEGFPDVVVEIYDRWGRLVYKSVEGYPTPWDGTNMNGNLVPTGSYMYVFMLKYADYKRVTGSVTVIK
ncbi:MAG: gliding motility-associated C-terminal domain-containing protein, partial [Bacteroidales bacterium]|nr:gliding motility-associated C-terminal domain-containing protein [Bacteroidales bacterium]